MAVFISARPYNEVKYFAQHLDIPNFILNDLSVTLEGVYFDRIQDTKRPYTVYKSNIPNLLILANLPKGRMFDIRDLTGKIAEYLTPTELGRFALVSHKHRFLSQDWLRWSRYVPDCEFKDFKGYGQSPAEAYDFITTVHKIRHLQKTINEVWDADQEEDIPYIMQLMQAIGHIASSLTKLATAMTAAPHEQVMSRLCDQIIKIIRLHLHEKELLDVIHGVLFPDEVKEAARYIAELIGSKRGYWYKFNAIRKIVPRLNSDNLHKMIHLARRQTVLGYYEEILIWDLFVQGTGVSPECSEILEDGSSRRIEQPPRSPNLQLLDVLVEENYLPKLKALRIAFRDGQYHNDYAFLVERYPSTLR